MLVRGVKIFRGYVHNPGWAGGYGWGGGDKFDVFKYVTGLEQKFMCRLNK